MLTLKIIVNIDECGGYFVLLLTSDFQEVCYQATLMSNYFQLANKKINKKIYSGNYKIRYISEKIWEKQL